MRKIALTIGLFLIFLLIPQSRPEAGCEFAFKMPGGGTFCKTGTVACSASMATVQCCTTVDECPAGTIPEGVSQTYKICDAVPVENNQRETCRNCMETGTGAWTAIGCIQTGDDPGSFLKTLLGLGMGLAGGIAFLLILFGGLQIMTSAGNPEQLNSGRELVSAAVTGLILIIFSIFLLSFIGVKIIGIPGFGTSVSSGPGR